MRSVNLVLSSIVCTSRFRGLSKLNYIYLVEKTDGSIPAFILKLPGMADILLSLPGSPDNESTSLSEGALTVMQSAAHYQSKASGSRFATPKSGVGSTCSQPHENTKFTNLSKAHKFKAERKAKKEEFRNKDTAIRIGATLWSLDDKQKMTQVHTLRI